jgi:hypothetical protein
MFPQYSFPFLTDNKMNVPGFQNNKKIPTDLYITEMSGICMLGKGTR